MGVEMKTGVTFGQDITLDSLKQDGYKAVYLATGLHLSRGLGVPGEDLDGVLKGVDFLRDVSLGNPVTVNNKDRRHRRRRTWPLTWRSPPSGPVPRTSHSGLSRNSAMRCLPGIMKSKKPSKRV